MTPSEQVKILSDALQRIGELTVEPGESATVAFVAAQRIAAHACRVALIPNPAARQRA